MRGKFPHHSDTTAFYTVIPVFFFLFFSQVSNQCAPAATLWIFVSYQMSAMNVAWSTVRSRCDTCLSLQYRERFLFHRVCPIVNHKLFPMRLLTAECSTCSFLALLLQFNRIVQHIPKAPCLVTTPASLLWNNYVKSILSDYKILCPRISLFQIW